MGREESVLLAAVVIQESPKQEEGRSNGAGTT